MAALGPQQSAHDRRQDRREAHDCRDPRQRDSGTVRVMGIAHHGTAGHGAYADTGRLKKPEHNHGLEAGRQGRGHAGQYKNEEAGQHHGAPAKPVAQESVERLGGGQAEQVDGDDPLDLPEVCGEARRNPCEDGYGNRYAKRRQPTGDP